MKNEHGTSAIKIGYQIDVLLFEAKEKELKDEKERALVEAVDVMDMNICNNKKKEKLKEVVSTHHLNVSKIEKKY